MSARRRRLVVLVVLVVAQAALLVAAVAPRLSARFTGRAYDVVVTAADPVEPWRGAYVALAYPDLRVPRAAGGRDPAVSLADGEVYLPLVADGDVWRAGTATGTVPEGPYLRCDHTWGELSCGIGSWFAAQDTAAEIGEALTRGEGVATLRVDDRGNAALVAVHAG